MKKKTENVVFRAALEPLEAAAIKAKAPAPRGARSILLAGRQVCLLAEENLTVYGGSTEKQIAVDPGGRQLLRLGGEVLVCYDDRAERTAIH